VRNTAVLMTISMALRYWSVLYVLYTDALITSMVLGYLFVLYTYCHDGIEAPIRALYECPDLLHGLLAPGCALHGRSDPLYGLLGPVRPTGY
jgi:hypothetical protein